MPASPQLAARVREDRNFEWLEPPSYGDETLEGVLALIDRSEAWVESGVAWETPCVGCRDGRACLVLRAHGPWPLLPVTRRSWRGCDTGPASEVDRAEAGRSPHGFLAVDPYDARVHPRAGITFHPMASGGREADQAHLVARTLGVKPDTCAYGR